MGEHGQGFLVLVLGAIGERNPCPYVSKVPIPESRRGGQARGAVPTEHSGWRLRADQAWLSIASICSATS
jgi:hypothetical protein